MRLLRAVATVLLLGLPLLHPPAASAQCAMCKTALTNSEEGRGLTREFNRAILVMLAAPYLLMGAGAAYLLRARIRPLASRAASRLRLARRPVVLRG